MEFFAEEIDSGSRCIAGHVIKLVAEGYGYCVEDYSDSRFYSDKFRENIAYYPDLYRPEFYTWRFSPPLTDAGIESVTGCGWDERALENGQVAWVQSGYSYAKGDILAAIRADMEAHRNCSFDEEAERARLMPV